MASRELFERRRNWFRDKYDFDLRADTARLIRAQQDVQRLMPETALRNAWRPLGPSNVNGRVAGLALGIKDSNAIYAGCSGGGVRRTSNDGNHWSPLMATEPSIAIGALCVHPADDSIFAATGEWTGGIGWGADPMLVGAGVLRSTDAGASWVLLAPIQSNQCSAIVVCGKAADVVLVGGNQGLELSMDAGASWQRPAGVLVGDVCDIAVDAADPDFVVVAIDRQCVLVSTDGARSWWVASGGLPSSWQLDAPKIAIAQDPKTGTRKVYVKSGDGLYVSSDSCRTFHLLKTFDDKIWFFSWCNVVSCHPSDANRILAGSNNLYLSEDGGVTWRKTGGYGTQIHPDQQSVVWLPGDPRKCYLANDGGVYRSTDGGRSWTDIGRGLLGGHFYCMSVSSGAQQYLAGAVQDDRGDSARRPRGLARSDAWRGGLLRI